MTYQPSVVLRQDNARPDEQTARNSDYILPHNGDEEIRYILTLDTDHELHDKLTALRKKYFPPYLNKIPGHLTLFHALPGSRLDGEIVPAIERLVKITAPFTLRAGLPFKLSKGIAIPVTKKHGGTEAQALHEELRRPWQDAGFLTTQDERPAHLHWTIMNKVSDEKKVEEAFQEVSTRWDGPFGQATGLRLWRYEADGHWTDQQLFQFAAAERS